MRLAARFKLPASLIEAAPASLGVVVYAALICVTLVHSVSRNEGHLAYAVDDTYIHMAMSKNLARYGVWGVTRYEFSASSSSPLWTLLLAGVYRLLGVSDVAPLVLNILIGIIALIMVDLIGLATADIARARLRLRHRPRSAIAPVLSDLVRRKKPRLTMVYAFAFSDKDALNPRIWEPCVPQYLPQELVPLGVWLTPRNVVCAGPMVSFYAFDRDDVEVRSRFLEATRRLPRDMVTRIFP